MESKRTKAIGRSAKNSCADDKCPFHGDLKLRGRIFEGEVVKKFPKRIVIEFYRTVYIPKYERYAKSKTRLHARLPDCKEGEISVGNYVKVKECRPISKLVHFAFLEKIR